MNQIDLSGRCAVVTGAAQGIGKAVAQRFVKSGAKVCLWDRDAKLLELARAQLAERGQVHAIETDVTDPEALAEAVEGTRATLGPIDILVNNAGIAGVTTVTWHYPVAEWQRVLETDLTGVFLCCRAVVPGMIERNYGRIVNVASIAGKEGNPMAAAYSASKAAVIGLTKAVGKDVAKTGVVVNCIAPAVIQTPILEGISQEHVDYMLERVPMGRMGLAEEVAALACWLASEECSFSTGATYDISGGRAVY